MKYEYKVVQVPLSLTADKAHHDLDFLKNTHGMLQKFGDEGWELVSASGEMFYLKRVFSDAPDRKAKVCGNCQHFTQKSGEIDLPGLCSLWKLALDPLGGCAEFSGRVEKDIPIIGVTSSLPAGVVPDELSGWHFQPRTEIGEKRIEAVTNQVDGVQSPSHKHRVVLIMDKDGKVVRGKTDMVNGHDHAISFAGMTDEADGHTHVFSMPG